VTVEATHRPVVRRARRALWRLRLERDVRRARVRPADLSIFHEFVPAPAGGASQALRALTGECERRGITVQTNVLAAGTRACLFNSFNFDFRRLRRSTRPGLRLVHRVDGPIASYRGFDDGTDARIAELNAELAAATVLQSSYSRDAHAALGIELRNPVVVRNTVDPAIFHPSPAREPPAGRRIRVIASSWSDNPNKGSEVLAWLDRHLDRGRYELVFAGRTTVALEHTRMLGALPSAQLAAELRRCDVYLAPSRNDPCSNALLEGLACGLPAVYRASGGHPELVGDAGLAFTSAEEVPDALDRLVDGLDGYRAAIAVPSLHDVAERYLEILSAGTPT
jgi:glycosyltransferase involved in cell wall biosynthesis